MTGAPVVAPRPSRVTLEERTDEEELLLLAELLERGVELLERDRLLLLPELLLLLLLTALLLLLAELLERELELPLERTDEEELLLERELLLTPELLERELFLLSCCTAELLEREELLLERELLLTLEPDRELDEELEDRELLWLELLRELLWLELLRELLWLELLRELPEERVWAARFSPVSMVRARIREVVSVNNLLIASQFYG